MVLTAVDWRDFAFHDVHLGLMTDTQFCPRCSRLTAGHIVARRYPWPLWSDPKIEFTAELVLECHLCRNRFLWIHIDCETPEPVKEHRSSCSRYPAAELRVVMEAIDRHQRRVRQFGVEMKYTCACGCGWFCKGAATCIVTAGYLLRAREWCEGDRLSREEWTNSSSTSTVKRAPGEA